MHTFIYPSQDTYLNNSAAYRTKNFGIDEILEVYASNNGNKLVYTNPLWHTPPQNSNSYGNEGWLAYDESYIYVYSGSAWRSFPIANSIVDNIIAIAAFTGRISNVTTDPKTALYFSGTAAVASGSFSGSYSFASNTYVDGLLTTGSFNGALNIGSTFDSLVVNGSAYTVTPLTSSLVGSGSFHNFNGVVVGTSCTGTGPLCVENGTFSGSVYGTNFSGYVSTVTSSRYYYIDLTNFEGYFKGEYSGSVTPPDTAQFLLKPDFSRTMVQFDLTNVSQSIAKNQLSSSNIKFSLNMTACGQRNLPLDYTIYAYPISQSWYNGDGRWADGGTTMGASWDFRNYSGSGQWVTPMTSSYQQVDYLRTASYGTASFQNGGGTWYYIVPASYTDKPHWICSSSAFPALSGSGLVCSQSYTLGQQGDITMDVTRIVRAWLCGCVPNNGIILATSLETSVPPVGKTNGLLQFFSKETNTIYSPYMDVAWDDSVLNTGSLSPVTGSTENLITLQQLKGTYKAGSLPKVFVFARDRYPLKNFQKAYQQPSMITPKYLPSSSYFMIKDAESEEVLIDFDEYSKLSCDPTKGNYFKFDTTGLPQERYFKIFIKAEYPDGTVDIVDTAKVFKIIR
jgi:hypothetical protein